MPKILVTSTPSGEAPDWVREAWVGLKLPLSRIPEEEYGLTVGPFSRRPVPEEQDGYRVDSDAAVDALRGSQPNAAEWWITRGYGLPGSIFVFGRQFCEPVS